MAAAAALRREERRARLSVRGAVIGAGAVSRNPLPGSGGGGPRNRARRSVFRLPGLRAHISRLFRVSAGARPRGMPFRSQVGARPPGASWILQWRPLETLIRRRRPPPDRGPLRTAFRLLRSSLLANLVMPACPNIHAQPACRVRGVYGAATDRASPTWGESGRIRGGFGEWREDGSLQYPACRGAARNGPGPARPGGRALPDGAIHDTDGCTFPGVTVRPVPANARAFERQRSFGNAAWRCQPTIACPVRPSSPTRRSPQAAWRRGLGAHLRQATAARAR